MSSLRVIVVLFAAMMVVCLGSVVTAVMRVEAARRTESRTDALRDRLSRTEQALRAAREQTVDVSAASIPAALSTAGKDTFELAIAECENFQDCAGFSTATVRLTGCDGIPVCVGVDGWTGRVPAPMVLTGETWTAEGELPRGELICDDAAARGTWRFTASVLDARYSIAGGWQPRRLAADLVIGSPAVEGCGDTTLRWTREVILG
ncbi:MULTISPECIES: hypothetical protein [Actinoplanes]|uniref:hypothetical protein n=1 Tax=Actinoplanes TaxID=1865 RepID=UPI0005F2D4DE|nr:MULTISPECIES: hypothetical protein [Actinoplanes]GLY08188.1 hypothetical protein Acsp01_85670 [Actinoplanes sp. NBRC 101535]